MAGGAGGRGPRRGAPPGTGAWAGARPADVGLRAWEGRECPPGLGGAHADPRAGPSLPGLCGSGVGWGAGGGGPRAQKPPGPRQAGAQVSGARVRGRAGAGSLCLFISDLIRTASGELRCAA